MKVDKANAFLKKHPPFAAIKEVENNRIKAYFEQGIALEQIAVNMKFSENEISLRLTEMGLIQLVKV